MQEQRGRLLHKAGEPAAKRRWQEDRQAWAETSPRRGTVLCCLSKESRAALSCGKNPGPCAFVLLHPCHPWARTAKPLDLAKRLQSLMGVLGAARSWLPSIWRSSSIVPNFKSALSIFTFVLKAVLVHGFKSCFTILFCFRGLFCGKLEWSKWLGEIVRLLILISLICKST